MSATINIVETTTELGVEVVQVTVTDASAPGPAGPGVPTGGTDGQVLTKTSATDYATAWEDPTGGSGGAPTDVDYLVGTASGDLSAEIVVGTSPGGELGGTWASPTVDATHSGSSHAAVQAAAEATAAAALSSHETDQTNVHGIADTSVLATDTEVATAVSDHNADTTSVHGIADTSALALTANAVMDGDTAGGVLSGTYPNPGFASDMATQAELDAHINDSSDAHDASAISIADAGNDFTATDVEGALAELQSDHETDAQNLADHIADSSAAHAASAISADSTTLVGTETNVQGVLEELDNSIADHLADSSDAHDASAISITDAGSLYTGTDVEAALQEIGAWTSFTGTLEGTVTDPTLGSGGSTNAFYARIGSTIIVRCYWVFGSSGTNAGSGSYFVLAPTAIHTDSQRFAGTCWTFDGTSTFRQGICELDAANDRILMMVDTGSATATITHAVPHSWGTGDQLSIDIIYKAG